MKKNGNKNIPVQIDFPDIMLAAFFFLQLKYSPLDINIQITFVLREYNGLLYNSKFDQRRHSKENSDV